MPDVDMLRDLSVSSGAPTSIVWSQCPAAAPASVLSASAAVAALVVAVGIAAAAMFNGPRAQQPVPQPSPSPTESPSLSTEWTPERFRDEGTPTVLIPLTESGLTVTQYVACSGTCEGELSNRAIEVAQGGESAVFEVRGLSMSFSPVWVQVFDEDSVLVQDAAQVGRPEGQVRYRLLQADGTAAELERVDDPAPAVLGPHVFVIDPYSAWSRGSVGPDDREELYLVDDSDGTLLPLDVPEEVKQWAPDVDEVLWGANDCRVIWQQPGGGFEHHDVDCRNPGITDLPEDYWSYLVCGSNRVACCSWSTTPTGSRWSCTRAWTWGPPGSGSRSRTATGTAAPRSRRPRWPLSTRWVSSDDRQGRWCVVPGPGRRWACLLCLGLGGARFSRAPFDVRDFFADQREGGRARRLPHHPFRRARRRARLRRAGG